jgi:hypothetical protein
MLENKKLNELKERLEQKMGVKIRPNKIIAITVNPASHSLPKMHIVIGREYKNLEPDAPLEQVLAIFEATTFIVCTQNRGVEKGIPYFFAREDVRKVEVMD